MFFVISGFVLIVLVMCISIWKDLPRNLYGTLITCLVMFAILPPCLIHLGYNDPQLEQTVELVSLTDDIASVGEYVTVSGEKVYTYRYEVENTTELEGKMYKTATVSGDVQEVESSECKEPMLYIYVEKTKNSEWFSVHTKDRYVYIFYVPEGTITHEITLD